MEGSSKKHALAQRSASGFLISWFLEKIVSGLIYGFVIGDGTIDSQRSARTSRPIFMASTTKPPGKIDFGIFVAIPIATHAANTNTSLRVGINKNTQFVKITGLDFSLQHYSTGETAVNSAALDCARLTPRPTATIRPQEQQVLMEVGICSRP
jgi:hypothetical protein